MWDTAVTAMVAFSALGFFIADGEMASCPMDTGDAPLSFAYEQHDTL